MLRRPSCVSYCAGVWTGVCLRGAWLIASVVVCVSVRMGFASSTACMMDALSVGMRSDPSELPKEVRPIEKVVCNYHTSFALGTVQVQTSGGQEASSDQGNTDAPYLTHQNCGYEGKKLYNT